MVYPTFEITKARGIIPRLYLPRDFKKRVRLFYEQGRKEDVERYVRELEAVIKGSSMETKIGLQWSDTDGLRNISVSPSCGLDLNDRGIPSFQEHNLGGRASFIAGAIATKYVSELLKV